MEWQPSFQPGELARRHRAYWRSRFPIGCRVWLPPERVAHLSGDLPSRHGVVVGYGRDAEVIRVRLDGTAQVGGWHASFLEVEAPPAKARHDRLCW
jgi:hypothetical protein